MFLHKYTYSSDKPIMSTMKAVNVHYSTILPVSPLFPLSSSTPVSYDWQLYPLVIVVSPSSCHVLLSVCFANWVQISLLLVVIGYRDTIFHALICILSKCVTGLLFPCHTLCGSLGMSIAVLHTLPVRCCHIVHPKSNVMHLWYLNSPKYTLVIAVNFFFSHHVSNATGTSIFS